MKNLYTCLGFLAMFFVVATAQSQVLILEDFEEGVPNGWSVVGFLPSSDNPCEGDQSVRRNFTTDDANGTITTSSMEATGESIEVSFEYKIIDVDTGDPVDDDLDFGTMNLEYSIDGGDTWTTDASGTGDIIDDTVYSDPGNTDCITHTYTITGVSNEDNFAWRFDGDWNDGDYHFYLDNLSIVEEVDCIQPYNVSIDNISFDEAEISWEDLNGTPDEWTVEYLNVGSAFSPGTGLGTEETATTTSITLDGLDDGQEYTFYIQTVCDSAAEVGSVWEGPYTFQTVAIGTDCDVPIEIASLPYDDESSTGVYGNSYEGSAGDNCGASGDYLDGYDVVYHYTPATDDILQIELMGDNAGADIDMANTGIFIYEACADIGSICFDGSTSEVAENHGINDVFVTGGQDYYIVISSFPAGGNDSFNYYLEITGFDCSTWEEPSGDSTVEFIDGQTLADFTNTGSGANPTIVGATLTWYEDAALTTEIADPTTIDILDGDTYWVTQTIGTCESDALEMTFDEFDCAASLEIVSTVEGDAPCESGTVELSAQGGAGESNNIFWYEDETGGEPVYVGENFETPELTETTSYWVAEGFIGEGNTTGQGNPGPSTVATSTVDAGLNFEVTSNITLENVQVFAVGSGNLTVEVAPVGGGNTEAVTVTIPSGGSSANPMPVVVPLGFSLTPGDYTLEKVSGPGLIYTTSAGFPYDVGVSGEVTGGTSTAGTYYYFYNWTIIENKALCESERTEVVAEVYDVLSIDVEADSELICDDEDVTLTGISDEDDYEYTAEWDGGVESEVFDANGEVVLSPNQTTTYTIYAENTVTGCEPEPVEITIEVIGLPDEYSISPKVAEVCIEESLQLSAGAINEGFEDEADVDWTADSNSSDTGAEWELVESPHTIEGTVIQGNGDQFYVSNAASIINEDGDQTLDETLTSEAFSLVGVEEASIEFYQYYRYRATTVQVQASTNGTDWDDVATYSSNEFEEDGSFTHTTVELNDYLDNAEVQVRFSYTGTFGWWWAIDDVTILREFMGDVIWTSDDPDALGNLYINQGATTQYSAGSSASTVYYNGLEAGDYTFTATLDMLCGEVSEDITVTVYDTPAPEGEQQQLYEEGETLADLEVTGDDLTWYVENEEGDFVEVIEETALEHEATYYVSQTQNRCEGGLLMITTIYNCPAPVNVEVTETSSTTATITWEIEEEEKIEHYYFEVLNEAGEVVTSGYVLNIFQTIVIPDLEPDTEYTYVVYAICDEAEGVFGNEVGPIEFETEEELSVDHVNFTGLTYYPNPTENVVTFTNSKPIETVEVYNLLGQKVRMQKAESTTLTVDFSGLASGAYLAKLTVDGATNVVRIIKE